MRHDHGHIGAGEVCAMLDISRQRLHQLRQLRPDFPAPVLERPQYAVWHTADIERWAAEHPREARRRERGLRSGAATDARQSPATNG